MTRRFVVTGGSGFIGTNLIERLRTLQELEIWNLDVTPPKESSHESFYRYCDILNQSDLTQKFEEFCPTHVIHLAGRTDTFGKHVEDYAANHVGTTNLLAAILDVGSVQRAIFTSSQFVVAPGKLPANDIDYKPHTVYGESKVLSEIAIRNAPPDCIWTIIRPTNIWGKWHSRYPQEFWKVLADGLYVHPSGKTVTRCYGYVGNVVEQVLGLLDAEAHSVCGRVFYVGDPPVALLGWVNAFSLSLTGRNVRQVPYPLVAVLAHFGDILKKTGKTFPLSTSRLRSMTEDYLTPMEPTFSLLGYPKIDLQQGVDETVAWLRSTQAHR